MHIFHIMTFRWSYDVYMYIYIYIIYICMYRQNSNIRRTLDGKCRSLRCSWSIAYRRCSNYIFFLDLTLGFNGLGKDKSKTRREPFKFWYFVCLILDILRHMYIKPCHNVFIMYIYTTAQRSILNSPCRTCPAKLLFVVLFSYFCYKCLFVIILLNPLRAIFFRGNKNIYLHFM